MAEPAPKRQRGDDEEQADLGPAENGGEEDSPFVAELEDIQRQLDKVNDEASDKVLAVEQEYNKKRRPIYSKRNEVIKKVPLFWQRTLLSHPIIADSLTDDDTAILEHMTELDVEDFDDIKSGFRIVLRFAASNPFFSDAALVKEFHYGDDGKVAIHPATINWTEGHAPQGHHEVGSKRPGDGRWYLFFEWLASDLPTGDGTPDALSEALKEEVWPNPLKFYFAEVPEGNFEEVEAEELQFEEEYDGAGLGLDEGEGEGVYEEGGEGEEGLGEEGLLDAGVEGGEGEEAFGEEGDGGEGSFGEGDY